MHYCPYEYYMYIVFDTFNSTDKQNNLEMSSLLILSMVTTLVKYKINASQPTMSFVCRSKCICLLSHSDRHWYPLSHPFLTAHKTIHLQCLYYSSF